MTKLDKANFSSGGNPLPNEFNDAHAALRGYSQSNLISSIIFSAGMNPRLYGYMESFKDFFPNSDGNFKKKIIIKVSDFRSALIQGKFLAKKGLWVSEFRIESGLNCGGHAFPTNGNLLGPILEEFLIRNNELHDTVRELYLKSLSKKGLKIELGGNLYAASGIGASAASCVAIAKALSEHFNLNLSDEEINKIAYEGEKGYHGTPSGIDNTASTFGGLIWFEKGSNNVIERIDLPSSIEVVIGNTGKVADTAAAVAGVRERKEKFPEKYNEIMDRKNDDNRE